MSSRRPDDRSGGSDGELDDEDEQVRLAEAEAAGVGGRDPEEDVDPAWHAVAEGGGGEAEGFEEAESELIEHGDEQSAHAVLHRQGQAEEVDDADEFGEADHERSSETEAD